jgi:prepilin-type N-terminal cleavage/methylation domain-containing protein
LRQFDARFLEEYNMSRQRAFTLVEVLVVIAIIGVLIALLLPAVQAAREASRMISCKNNLKQIGLAIHNYHDLQRRLPAGWTTASSNPEGPNGWSWAAAILPQMEQRNLQDRIRFDLPISDPANQVVRASIVPSLVCPSDILEPQFQIYGNGPADEFANQDKIGSPLFLVAKSNYAGVFGLSEIEDVPSAGEGTFYHNSRLTFASITDGLSNTLIVGERGSKLGGSVWTGVILNANNRKARIVGTADHTPNHVDHHFDDFSSFHVQGAHFLAGDGSVQRINSQIDLATYQALVTRSGGEPVSSQP